MKTTLQKFKNSLKTLRTSRDENNSHKIIQKQKRSIYNPKKPTPLLTKLPSELRLLIWAHVFSGDKDETCGQRGAIVRTCRVIYSETQNLIYSHTRFQFGDIYAFRRFPDGLTPAQQPLFLNLQFLHLHIEFYCELDGDDFMFTGRVFGKEAWPLVCETLVSLSKLRELKLEIDDEARRLEVEEVEGLRSVRVRDVAEVEFWYRPKDEVKELLEGFRCGASENGEGEGERWKVVVQKGRKGVAFATQT